MAAERSAGIILFKNTPDGRKYLVLHSSGSGSSRPDFWDFPKGILDKGETALEAAGREAKEEAGVEDLGLTTGFKETARYFTRREGKPVPKFVAMFLAEVKNDKIKLSWEHDKYEWLSYGEAYERISLQQMKEILEKAELFSAAYEPR